MMSGKNSINFCKNSFKICKNGLSFCKDSGVFVGVVPSHPLLLKT